MPAWDKKNRSSHFWVDVILCVLLFHSTRVRLPGDSPHYEPEKDTGNLQILQNKENHAPETIQSSKKTDDISSRPIVAECPLVIGPKKRNQVPIRGSTPGVNCKQIQSPLKENRDSLTSTEKETRSVMWNHVKKVGDDKVECSYCYKQFKFWNNTTNMLKHLKTQHPIFFQSGARASKVTNLQQKETNCTSNKSTASEKATNCPPKVNFPEMFDFLFL